MGRFGEVVERLMAPASKAGRRDERLGSSNLPLSGSYRRRLEPRITVMAKAMATEEPLLVVAAFVRKRTDRRLRRRSL